MSNKTTTTNSADVIEILKKCAEKTTLEIKINDGVAMIWERRIPGIASEAVTLEYAIYLFAKKLFTK